MARPLRWRSAIRFWSVLMIALIMAAPAIAQSATPPKANFLHDVARDYLDFVSWDSLRWLAVGGVISVVVAEADDAVRLVTARP